MSGHDADRYGSVCDQPLISGQGWSQRVDLETVEKTIMVCSVQLAILTVGAIGKNAAPKRAFSSGGSRHQVCG